MNRLQKKCVIATAGIHLLLLTILIVGPAFYNPQPKPDNTQVLDVIPANVIDAAFNSGVRHAAPPAPAPVVTPPPLPAPPTPAVQPPAPQPPAPKPVVTPPPTLTERVKEIFRPEPKPEPARAEPAKPAPEKSEPKRHQIQVNTQLVARTASRNSTAASRPDTSQRDTRNTRALDSAIRALRHDLSKGTTVEMPGDSSVAYANYASVVKSVYDAAWTLPNEIAKDENIIVKVTIASDGTVLSSRIVTPSGDAPADASVQRTLDRVTFIAPFPEGSTDKERTYTINFNPQVKSSE